MSLISYAPDVIWWNSRGELALFISIASYSGYGFVQGCAHEAAYVEMRYCRLESHDVAHSREPFL
jgi:hypothetical protein